MLNHAPHKAEKAHPPEPAPPTQETVDAESAVGTPIFMGGEQNFNSGAAGDDPNNGQLPLFLKSKLSISAADDPLETEAEEVAQTVMQQPADDTISPAPVQIQRKASANQGVNAPSQVHDTLNSSGSPLNPTIQSTFESRLGADFSDVRIHTDSQAAQAAESINAHAFTSGSDIAFGSDEYQPESDSGQELLAHELVHVVQQGGQIGRIDRAPGDKDPLERFPLAATKTKTELLYAFQNIYADAAGGITDFEGLIKSACVESLASFKLTADQTGSVNASANEIAGLTDGMDINGVYETMNLAQAIKRLYELMHLKDSFGITFEVSYGFEYIFDRLASHSADLVGLNLQEFAHGADIAADPDLSLVAGDSDNAFEQLWQDFNRIMNALRDGKSLLMLELEGLVSELVNLRNQFNPRSSQDEQNQNYLQRGELSRQAILLNKRLMEMTDNPTAATPLDESVKKTMSGIRQTAKSEDDTRKEMGDKKSLLAAQPLNMADRVDDPFFQQSGLSEQDEAGEIEPGMAFPKTTGRFVSDTHAELADRINNQSDTLQAQLSKIVPPHESSKYDLKEFVQVYKHWFSLFGIEKEKAMLQQMHVLDLYYGMHGATAIGTLSTSGDVGLAMLRYETMQQAMDLLGFYVSSGVDTDFQAVIRKQRLQRKQKLSGSGASDARYEFAELYDNKNPYSEGGEQTSRLNVSTQNAQTSSEQFSRVAKMPGFLQTQAAHQQGLTPQPLPVMGLRTVQAQEGWSYLVEIPDYMTGNIVAYEQKTATPEVAEFLLAQQQHAATLKTTHSAYVSVPSPGKTSNSTALKPVGITPALEGPTDNRVESADSRARALIGMPGRDSSKTAPTGTQLLQSAMIDYLNTFFSRGDAALRIAAIIHIMNVEHNIGKAFDQMLDPEEIAKVLAKAFAIGFGLGVLSSMGPIGQILSVGIGKAMKIAGGSDLTAAVTVAGFLKLASEAGNFTTARMMGYIGVPIVEDIKQLFESVISAPAAMAGEKAAGASVKFVLDRIQQKPPATIAEAADLARQLADASPEVRKDMLAATENYLADLKAQGAGTTQSSKDYDMMLAFRNELQRQSTIDQVLDPYTTKLDVTTPNSKIPFVGPQFRLRTAGERAKLLEAMGDLQGKVMLFEDPSLHGADAGTVRVYYDNGQVRLHVGMEATAHDIELHMPTVRNLRKYEGVRGSIRILAERAISLLGFTNTPQYGSKGFEAKQEIEKLTAIRDDLIAKQDAIDLNARRHIDKEIDSTVIDRQIIDIQTQINEHMRNLDSLEAGVGFVAARKKSGGLARAEALGLDKVTPDGHFWREREGQLELVQKDTKAEGFFVNQDILAAEIAKGKAGDPKLAIRPIAENVSASKLAARSLGLEAATPAGHIWTTDSTGALGLVRRDSKQPQFWFDHEAYTKATDKSNPAQFIRPIAEKANSDSESAKFDAKTWDEAYTELGGDGTSTSFGKFNKVIRELGVDKVTVIERMKQTEGGDPRSESPSGLGIRTIRHSTKQYYIENVIMPHLTNPDGLMQTARYQEMIDAGRPHEEALTAASHERLLAITRQLDSADIGSLGEKWYAAWFSKTGDKSQFGVSKDDIAKRYPGTDLKENRNIDRLRLVGDENADIHEVKNVSTPFGKREKGEMDAHLALRDKDITVDGKVRTVKKVVWVILNPDLLTTPANVQFMKDYLKKNDFLEFHIYDENGNVVVIDSTNYESKLSGLVSAAKTSKTARVTAP